MHGTGARRYERPHNVFVGTGDSSFFQLPCPSAPLPQVPTGGTLKSSKIAQISCGATAAVALVVPVDTEDEPPLLLEWGTGLYGERLLPAVPLVGTAGTATSGSPAVLLNHPVVVSPWPTRVLGSHMQQAIRSIACGAHFVVAAIEAGGCISWGGGRGSRVLGRGGCGCGSCFSPSCSGGSVSPTTPQMCAGEPDWVGEPLGARGLRVTDLAAGDDHAVAICADGTAWAWGRGDCGQLGIGDLTASGGDGACVPTRVRIPTLNGSSLSSAPPADAAATTPAVAAVVNPSMRALHSKVARAAACGRDHSAILTNCGRLLTFGSGLHGQVRRGLK